GTAVESYAVDQNVYPVAASSATLATLVQPVYIKSMPQNDGWNFAFVVASTRTAYTVSSNGKDGTASSCAAGQTTTFADDICFTGGQFVRYPMGMQQ
ncbi:MAG TPA: hypothetical protein VFV19_11440, partial [Candidatus Polarisedimenticolaceae bacterium]|nr:hypothetical protein [Candidatus Polarisedimenticolaceae bacterium]